MQRAIKKPCSAAVGVDGTKGTDDDTFIEPQDLGFGATCLDVDGECGAIVTDALVASGLNDDLLECVRCVEASAADTLIESYFPLAP